MNEIARLGLDREQARPWLTEVVDTVAARLSTPFALITVLLDRAQAFAAGHGPIPGWLAEAGGTPIEWAFCTTLLRSGSVCGIPDLTADPNHRDNPLVTVAGVRAYLGAPLVSPHGHALGGLCALDLRPRRFTAEQTVFLQQMATEAVRRIESHAEPAGA
ncbi:GAF domain-containing protein [Actinoplanes sp. NPDC049802]|uniref:GAF domain-containing protein n=1 Tax=Actinoplanes sp. NPDC049802 TaxID=3154742 RepID=UPI0033D4B441